MDRDRVLPMGTVMFLLLAVGGMLWQRTPLRSGRPPISAGPESHVFQEENVNVRLWQDPVGAVERAWDGQLKALAEADSDRPLAARRLPRVNRLANLGAEILAAARAESARLAREAGDLGRLRARPIQVDIVPVIMTEGYHAVGVEARRRERQAVVRALAAEACAPRSDKRIGYVGTVWERQTGGDSWPRLVDTDRCARPFCLGEDDPAPGQAGGEQASFPVAFEWFQDASPQIDGGARHVLVLWIAEDKLHAGPAEMIAQIVGRIRHRFEATPVTTGDVVCVIGPATSGGLQKILDSRQRGFRFTAADSAVARLPGRLVFVSSRATAPAALLGHPEAAAGSRASAAAGLAVEVVRNIATDDRSLELIAGELKRRVPAAGGLDRLTHRNAPCVALFGEWDSAYGRAMLEIFQSQLTPEPGRRWHVRTYGLLRGIDGTTPHAQGDDPAQTMLSPIDDASGRGSVGLLMSGRTEARTMPFGRSQLDAFRRQADSLAREIRGEVDGGNLVAVGVLGADIFDKLLVIQAMRERYAGVMLFTTDLDAMFLHPSFNRWTRNLLIASGDGLVPVAAGLSLDASGSRQRVSRIPPFRDTYQTATFEATRIAIDPVKLAVVRAGGIAAPPPRLFEVGRDRAYDLTPNLPNQHRPTPWKVAVLLATLVLLAGLMLPLVRVGRDLPAHNHLRGWRAAGLVVVAAAAGLVILAPYLQPGNGGEPFYLAAGISIWPSLLLRLLAVAIAWYALFSFPIRDAAVHRRIEADLGLAPPADDVVAGVLPRLRNTLAGFRAGIVDLLPARAWNRRLAAGPAVSSDTVWQAFLAAGRPSSRSARVALGTALGFAIGIGLTALMSFPLPPFRGDLAYDANQATLWVASVLFFVLFFAALDGMRGHKQLLDLIRDEEIVWSPDQRNELGQRVGLSGPTHANLLDRVRSLELAARATEPLNRNLVYPFVVMLVMLLGRLDLFDNWGLPQLSQIFLLYLCGMVLAGGIAIYRQARAVRGRTLGAIADRRQALEVRVDELRQALASEAPLAARAAGGGGDVTVAERVYRGARSELRSELHALERLTRRVQSLDDGVFQSWTRHPLVRAGVLAGLVAATFLEQILRAL